MRKMWSKLINIVKYEVHEFLEYLFLFFLLIIIIDSICVFFLWHGLSITSKNKIAVFWQ